MLNTYINMLNTYILYVFNICAFSWNEKKEIDPSQSYV